MATDFFTMTGGKEVMEVLKKFPVEFETKILRGAVRASGVEIQKDARSRAPIEDGNLRKSIRVSSKRPRAGKVTASIKAGGKRFGVYYAHMIEFGTVPHLIKPKQTDNKLNGRPSKKALKFDGGAFAKADHPGIKPNPFMRTAMDTQTQNALDASVRYIKTRLDKEVKKLASRANRK